MNTAVHNVASGGKGENNYVMVLNNIHSFTLAALKIMHADTSHWVPAIEFYMSGDFYNYCLSSRACDSELLCRD